MRVVLSEAVLTAVITRSSASVYTAEVGAITMVSPTRQSTARCSVMLVSPGCAVAASRGRRFPTMGLLAGASLDSSLREMAAKEEAENRAADGRAARPMTAKRRAALERRKEADLEKRMTPKERVAHIGDSIHHDVAGAAGAAVPVVFIAGGIEHEALGIEPGELPAPEAVRRLCEGHGTQPPTHTAALVRWDAPVSR